MRIMPFVLAIAAFFAAPAMAEEAEFTLVESHGAFEIRDYPSLIVAEVEVEGTRRGASNSGFQPLANYIFGDNRPREQIAMTAPVTFTRAGAEIAMTAPVNRSPAGDGRWTVAFVMPSAWTMETLPVPNDESVTLRETQARRMAVMRFSGLMGERRVAGKLAELEAFMAEQGLQALSAPSYAAYDPPWTPAPMRRNEIWIEIVSR